MIPDPSRPAPISFFSWPGIQSRLSALGILRIPAYRYLVINTALNNMATESRLMAQAWLILALTNSDAWVGTVVGLPALLAAGTAMVGGVLADRWDRPRMLMKILLTLSAIALITALLVVTDLIQVWHLLAMTFVIALLHVSGNTVNQTMIIDTVPREELFQANAVFSAIMNLALVIGPSIAGLLLARAGVASAFFFSAAMYICASISASQIRVEQRKQSKDATSVWADFKGGLRYVRETPVLRWLLLVGFSVIGVGVWFTLVPRYAKDVLEVGATGYGAILSARGAGGLAGVVLLLSVGKVKRLGLVLVGGYLAFALLVVAFAFSTSLAVAMVAAFGLGIVFVWYPNSLRTAFQYSAADEMRGRVMSLFSMIGQLLTFGWFVGGALSEWVGPQAAMITVALLGFAVHLLAYLRSADLRMIGRS